MTERSTQGSPLDFPQHAAVDKTVREASSKAEQKLEEFDVEMRCVVLYCKKVGPDQNSHTRQVLAILSYKLISG